MEEPNKDTMPDLCKDCDPTFAAFLQQMAEHNKEQIEELHPKVVCPTCGKVHEFKFENRQQDSESSRS